MSLGEAYPEPSCPVCSKPVRSGTIVLYEGGDLFHVPCRSRQLELRSLEGVERAKAARTRSLHLIEQTVHRRTGQAVQRLAVASCPFCGRSAILTDWRPQLNW